MHSFISYLVELQIISKDVILLVKNMEAHFLYLILNVNRAAVYLSQNLFWNENLEAQFKSPSRPRM